MSSPVAPSRTAGPPAEGLIAHRLLVLPWNENSTDDDVDDMVAAVRKVDSHLSGCAG